MPLPPPSPPATADRARLEAALDAAEGSARLGPLLALGAALPAAEAERQAVLAREAYDLATAAGDAAAQARAIGLKGRAYFMLSENTAAVPCLAEAVARFEALGMADELYATRGALAGALANVGQYEAALERALVTLDSVRESGDRTAEGWTLNGLSAAYADLGDADRALEAAEQARDVFAALGHPLGLARAETSIGTAYLLREQPDAAEQTLTAAMARFHGLGDAAGESRVLDDLGTAARLRGDVEAGLALHREALARRRATANRQAQSTSLLHIGEALVALGRPAEAVEALAEALALAERVGARPREEQVHAVLAEAYGALGDPAQALRHARAHMAVREAILDDETRSRLQTMQVRFETDRLREAQAAEAARAEALRAANARLVETLDELRDAQRRLVQTEKLASLGRVTSGIAHEIRNPLNFVVNFAGLAADLVADVRDALAAHPDAAVAAGETLDLLADNVVRIGAHGQRANAIVTGMLEHVRTVGGPRGVVGLDELVESALLDVRESAPSGLVLVREVEAVEVEAVAGALRRAFANVLANAHAALADHAPAAPAGWAPTLHLATRRVETETGPAVEVDVSDNGPGVAPESRGLVFEPFYTTRPAGQGTGLGLSLAYDIVTEGHAGRLAVGETPGGGATFTVTLPVARPASAVVAV